MKKNIFIVLLLLSTILLNTSAQEKAEGPLAGLLDTDINLGLAVELKNAHIWRGQDVTHNALIDVDMRVMDKSKTFAFGLWGATTFTSDFREFDYYAGFYKGGFSLEVWDVFNFSEKNEFDPVTNTGYNTKKAFDYSAHETGHFIDVRLAYQFSKKFPICLKWNTVVFGRDRARISTQDLEDPTIYHQKYSSSRYSTYVEVDYPLLKSDIIDVKVGVGGAFALKDSKIDGQRIKGHFYGESNGVVNTTLAFTKRLKISQNYTLPITATAVWNPEASKTYMEVALQVVSF